MVFVFPLQIEVMMSKRAKRIILVSLGVIVLPMVGLALLFASLHQPAPTIIPNSQAKADALAKLMLEAVNDQAWAQTGAIKWTFPRGHEHLWDKRRGFARVRFGGNEVLINLSTRKGQAKTADKVVTGPEADALLEKAWSLWCNDAFWINPVTKAFDMGTTRALVDEGGRPSLLVSYASGGVTPGDSYLWRLDEQNRPVAWRMWVSIIPIGGLEFSWKGWQQLPTKAWVATEHQGPLGINLNMKGVAAAKTLAELEPGPDPFSPLLNP